MPRTTSVRVTTVGAQRAARHCPQPGTGFEPLTAHVAVMPGPMDACLVDGEQVTAQDGDFYRGWITWEVAGPFKGAPGTWGW